MISQSRYVNIISGVGGGAAVAQRSLIMRIVTRNTTIPPGIVAEFSNSDAVGAFFGTSSEEYKRSQAYFAFISKAINSPSLISFTRWVDAPIAPSVVGDNIVKNLAALKSVIAPTLTLTANGVAVNIPAIDLSQTTDLNGVALALQTAITAVANPELSAATVVYNPNTNQFTLTASPSAVGPNNTLVATATGNSTDISALLGWTTTGTVNVNGQNGDTPDQAIASSAAISNNFGSFVYVVGTGITNAQYTAIAAWADSQNNNYMFSLAVTLANAATLYNLIKGFSGVAINILSATLPNDFIEQSPCEILAATDYTKVNAAQNYMYYQFPNRNVTITNDTDADTADSVRANYIGQTQEAGQPLAFYQRGILCGGSTAAVDMNVFANEMWLKSANSAKILALFLALPEIPANDDGRVAVMAVLQTNINIAKNNGTISAGKTLNVIQQQYIGSITGDQQAWRQVQTIGYWLDVQFDSYVNNNTGLTEWEANYTLLYSKGDAIRKVNGTDSMI